MKYQTGDTILLLHSGEEGKIIEIIDKEMLMIDVSGVTFPVYTDQVDFPYYKRFTEKKMLPPKKEQQYIDDLQKEKPVKKEADGVWLSFLPVMRIDEFGDDVVEELKLHLINHTNTAYRFIYRLKFFGENDFELKNEVRPFEDFYLHDIPFSDLNDSPVFEFEFSLLSPDKQKADFFEANMRLKPKQLFAKIEAIRVENKATFSHQLFAEYPNKAFDNQPDWNLTSNKELKMYNASQARQHLPPPRTVIDLHIEKLADNWRRMSNYEIMDMQLKEFDKWFEIAVLQRQATLIVVHGVGEGVLRNEIHDILRSKREVKSFVNQYHPSFGYGATEIYFQY